MIYLASSVVFFLVFVAVHVWGVRRGWFTLRVPSLAPVFAASLVSYGAVLVVVRFVLRHAVSGSPFDVPFVFSALVLYGLACLCYINECSGLIDHESPSMQIVGIVERAAGQGVSYEEIRKILTDDVLVLVRLRELVIDGYVAVEGERYTLLPMGSRLARFVALYRALIRRGLGG